MRSSANEEYRFLPQALPDDRDRLGAHSVERVAQAVHCRHAEAIDRRPCPANSARDRGTVAERPRSTRTRLRHRRADCFAAGNTERDPAEVGRAVDPLGQRHLLETREEVGFEEGVGREDATLPFGHEFCDLVVERRAARDLVFDRDERVEICLVELFPAGPTVWISGRRSSVGNVKRTRWSGRLAAA